MTWDDERFARFRDAVVAHAKGERPGYGYPHVLMPYDERDKLAAIDAARALPAQLDSHGLSSRCEPVAAAVAQVLRRYGTRNLASAEDYERLEHGIEHPVDVAERATSGFLEEADLPAGRVFVLGRDRADRRPCVFRVEVELVPGTGRASLSGVRARGANDTLHTAFDFVRNHLTELGIAKADPDRDIHVQC